MISCIGRIDDYLLTLRPLQDESPIILDESFPLAQASALPLYSEYNEGYLAEAGLKGGFSIYAYICQGTRRPILLASKVYDSLLQVKRVA